MTDGEEENLPIGSPGRRLSVPSQQILRGVVHEIPPTELKGTNGKPEETETDVTTVASTLKLPEFKGTLYDGSSGKQYNDWLEDMKTHLGPVRAYQCLVFKNYQGFFNGKRVDVTAIPALDIQQGVDLQSAVSLWMRRTLTGKAKAVYIRLETELERKMDKDGIPTRMAPSAYEVHQAIKGDAKPKDSAKYRRSVSKEMNKIPFPTSANYDTVFEWLEQKRAMWNQIIVMRPESEDEPTFVLGLTSEIEPHVSSEQLNKLEEYCAADPSSEGDMSIEGLKTGLKILYPQSFKKGTGTMLSLQNN